MQDKRQKTDQITVADILQKYKAVFFLHCATVVAVCCRLVFKFLKV